MESFPEFTRDASWQFIGAILAFLALIITLVIFLKQRQIRSLAYEVISTNQLLTVREELESKLQVLYEGRPTRDICLIVLKVINNGNVAIPSVDYEREISFFTGSSSKILSAVVTAVDPENLNVDIKINDEKVSIHPVLLNPKDSITLKLLVSDFSKRISIDARVLGVKRINEIGEPRIHNTFLGFLFLVIMGIGFYFFVSALPHREPVKVQMPVAALFGLITMIVGNVGVIYTTLFRSGMFKRLFQELLSRLADRDYFKK